MPQAPSPLLLEEHKAKLQQSPYGILTPRRSIMNVLKAALSPRCASQVVLLTPQKDVAAFSQGAG